MLSFDDPRWGQLNGGYRMLYDPRPVLARLEAGEDTTAPWYELWDELHHQGDMGEASYATVPHLVRIYRQSAVIDWNTYAIVGTIELARGERVDLVHGKRKNPELPDWMKDDHFGAIRDLAETGIKELPDAKDQYDLRGILCILALHKGARTYARLLLDYSEEELRDIESAASQT